MQRKQSNVLALAFLLIFFAGCGRKTRNIFAFDEHAAPRISKLSFSAVQGVVAQRTPQGNLIRWVALEVPKNPQPTAPYFCVKNFTGYNVYRLVRTNIIPKGPRNKHPIKDTSFLDRHAHAGYYLVRAVFTCDHAVTEGPVSHIVYTQENKE